jgi:hypothetical protein
VSQVLFLVLFLELLQAQVSEPVVRYLNFDSQPAVLLSAPVSPGGDVVPPGCLERDVRYPGSDNLTALDRQPACYLRADYSLADYSPDSVMTFLDYLLVDYIPDSMKQVADCLPVDCLLAGCFPDWMWRVSDYLKVDCL